MSESIYIVPSQTVLFGDVIGQLDYLDDLRFKSDSGESIQSDSPWPDYTLRFYQFGLSTRSVEVHHDREAFQIRLLALYSPEERVMAAEIIEEITYASSGQIVREDGTVLDDLEEYRDLRIGKRIFDADAEFAAAEIEQRGVKFLTIGGPEGNFYLGPRSLRELRGTGRYQDALLDAMRDVQYMDRSQFHNAKIFSVAYEDGTKMTMSVWNSGPSFLFQGVDELSLLIDGRASKPEFLNIPYASLPHLVGDSFSWIDEQQSIVRAFTESEWPALLARARQYALRQSKQSPDAPPNKKKGWWPFK